MYLLHYRIHSVPENNLEVKFPREAITIYGLILAGQFKVCLPPAFPVNWTHLLKSTVEKSRIGAWAPYNGVYYGPCLLDLQGIVHAAVVEKLC